MRQGSIRPAGDQSIYTGQCGRTRRERFHVPSANGDWRSTEIIVSVNLATDPALRDLAMSGQLHASDGFAVSFTLHDPAARKFCLVVPESLRHRAIAERMELLELLSKEEASIPPYVWELRTVVGDKELRAYLDEKAQVLAGSDLLVRGDAIASEEAELRVRASKLVERERVFESEKAAVQEEQRSLLALREELESLRNDVELREQELEARLDVLREREMDLVERATAANLRLAQSLEPSLLREESTGVVLLSEFENPDDDELIEGSEVESELDDDEVEEEIDEDVEAELDDDEVEDEEVESDAPFADRADSTNVTNVTVPPPGFLGDPDIEMVALAGDPVRLFARLGAEKNDAFESADLLVQLAMVQGFPVVLLALVEATGDRPYVRRAVVDATSQDGRAVLQTLGEDFCARVALFSSDGRFLRTFDLSAPRESNVRAIVARVEAAGDFAIDAQTAGERALAVPPPVRDTHPFGAVDVGSARATLTAIAKLSAWSSDERRERALFALSLSVATVDAAYRSVGEAALRFGLALPAALRTRAIELGLAKDMPTLIAMQADAFRALTKTDERGGLSLKELAANWDALLAEAAEHELSIDADVQAEAWEIFRSVRGDTRTRASLPQDVDLSRLPELGTPQLVILLDHPKVRRHAAVELCRRGDGALSKTVIEAVRRMPRADVVAIAPHLARLGEAAGDALIDCLGARKAFVRQAAVLVLGQLKLRRAITPLVNALATEENEIWRDVARVLGEFGTAAVRPLAKLAKDRKNSAERVELALSHAAVHGAKTQVQQLATDEPAVFEKIVEVALSRQDDARLAEARARGEKPAGADDAIFEISRKFYKELATLSLEASSETTT